MLNRINCRLYDTERLVHLEYVLESFGDTHTQELYVCMYQFVFSPIPNLANGAAVVLGRTADYRLISA